MIYTPFWLPLAHGYVVAIPGCRGRDTRNEDGSYNGKGVAGLVDDITGEALVLNEDYTGSYADFVLRWLSYSTTEALAKMDSARREALVVGFMKQIGE